jgi:competence protein CoiA
LPTKGQAVVDMKYALVNRQRQEAHPNLLGQCVFCGDPMVAKCGEIKIWHWAHRGKRVCDPWKENETEWHRAWKGHFPADWQERIHTAENGERHIADVKTIKDWVIEFQHSHLKPIERRARNDFYKKLVWVVDGIRRKRDKKKFFESLEEVTQVTNPQSPVRRVFKVLCDDCALIRDWSDGPAPVFFDFGNEEPMLWCLLPKFSNRETFILEFWRTGFVVFHRNEVAESDYFADLIKNFKNTIADLNKPPVVIKQRIRPQYFSPRRHFRF